MMTDEELLKAEARRRITVWENSASLYKEANIAACVASLLCAHEIEREFTTNAIKCKLCGMRAWQ